MGIYCTPYLMANMSKIVGCYMLKVVGVLFTTHYMYTVEGQPSKDPDLVRNRIVPI